MYGRMFHLPTILWKKLFLSTFVIANLIPTLNSFKFVSVSLCERRPDNRTVFQRDSKLDLTREQNKVFKAAVSLRSLHVLFIRPSILFALAVIMSVWEFQDKLQSVNIPGSLNSLTSSRKVSFICTLLVKGTCFLVILIILHFLVLKSIWLRWLHWWSLSRSSWK